MLKNGNYDSFMPVSENVKNELEWWIKILHSLISHGSVQVTIKTNSYPEGMVWFVAMSNVDADGQ